MPNPSSDRATKMLAALEELFSPENQKKALDEIMASRQTRAFMRMGGRSESPTANHSLAVRESEALGDAKRDVERLETRNQQLKDELDRAFDEVREAARIPAPIKVELTLPAVLPDLNVNVKPSAGVELDYDAHGRVTGTRPRGSDPVTKALKKTAAGKSIVP